MKVEECIRNKLFLNRELEITIPIDENLRKFRHLKKIC